MRRNSLASPSPVRSFLRLLLPKCGDVREVLDNTTTRGAIKEQREGVVQTQHGRQL